MKSVTRRTAMTAVAVAPAALALSEATAAPSELLQLIEAHKAAYQAFGEAIDRLEAAKADLRKTEPIVPCLLGGGFSLYSHDFCKEQLDRAYESELGRIKQMERVAPDLAKQYHATIKAKKKENMKILDRMWKETGVEQEDQTCDAAADADSDAFLAVCSYRCQSLDEARLKAEYLLSTGGVKDFWNDDETELLRSFV